MDSRHYQFATVPQAPPDNAPRDTAYGSAEVGGTLAAGAVAPVNELQPFDGPPRVFMGPQQLRVEAPFITPMPPDSLYVDRPLFGGVRTSPAPNEYRPDPPNMGGFTVLAGGPPAVLSEGQRMEAQAYVTPASWRETPAVINLCQATPASLQGAGNGA